MKSHTHTHRLRIPHVFRFQYPLKTMEFVWSSKTNTKRKDKNQKASTRRRQRAILSCERCHRLRVKCDRGKPCSRCKSSNKEETCYYRPFPSGTPHPCASETKGIFGDSIAWTPLVHYGGGRARFSTVTHWAKLTVEVFDQPARLPEVIDS